MVEQSLVVLKEHLPTWKKIIDYSKSRIEFIRDYYSDEYADLLIRLDSAMDKVEKNIDSKKQVIISFTLDSMGAFKEMIYMFMNDNLKELDTTDMKNITSILSRCDNWISEYMNVQGDYYVRALGFNNYEDGFQNLI